MEFGKVYLFPTPIAEGNTESQLPNENLQRLKECDVFVVEELRTARRFLRKAGYMRDFADVEFFVLNEHTLNEDLTPCIELIKEGKTVGVMSEAGLPCVADPGATFVALCQRQGIRIEPLVGPSSIMMALMASGFNGQSFAFVGYLPAEKSARNKRIRELEGLVYRFNQTQIFIETPYRNDHLLESLIEVCSKDTMLCVACDIGGESQKIVSKSIAQWKQSKFSLHKKNTVFLLSK